MSKGPRYIFVADDFTGASDTLATLARAGQRVALFLDVPSPDAVKDLDAFGIATESRALSNADITTLMDQIGRQLAQHAADIIHLKICSTFDSAPDTGNFITAANALCRHFDFRHHAIVGGQPSLGRYCAFGNLFARGPGNGVFRIDRHPVMQAHPVTPMVESDLRRHVAALGGDDLILSDRLAPALAETGFTLFDALESADLTRIGRCLNECQKPILCIGASSVAQAVFNQKTPASRIKNQPFSRPLLTFVGSRSQISAEQIGLATRYSVISVAPEDLNAPKTAQQAARVLTQNQNVLFYVDDTRTAGQDPRSVAKASAQLICDLLERQKIGLLTIAGGDTSSAVISALKPQSLSCIGDIDPGVPLCQAHFGDGQNMPVVLKGGQVGRPGLFDDLANGLPNG